MNGSSTYNSNWPPQQMVLLSSDVHSLKPFSDTELFTGAPLLHGAVGEAMAPWHNATEPHNPLFTNLAPATSTFVTHPTFIDPASLAMNPVSSTSANPIFGAGGGPPHGAAARGDGARDAQEGSTSDVVQQANVVHRPGKRSRDEGPEKQPKKPVRRRSSKKKVEDEEEDQLDEELVLGEFAPYRGARAYVFFSLC
jgi:hypothetical protein